MDDEWRRERQRKMEHSPFFKAMRTLTNWAMLYVALSIFYDLYLKMTGQKEMGATPYPAPPDWMVRADQREVVEEMRRREIEEAMQTRKEEGEGGQ